MSQNNRTLLNKVRRAMVAIMSVMMILTLVTTISFNATMYACAAEGDEAQTEDAAAEAAGTGEEISGDEQTAAGDAEAQSGEETAGADAEAADSTEEDSQAAAEEQRSADPLDTGLRRQTEPPKVSASSYIVMSGSTSEVVLEKHAERKMAPGVMTMLMTAMVVIDNMYNDSELANTVDITAELAGYGDDFAEGETVSVGDLLNAMITGCSSQAAEALAAYSASSREIFINEMNSKAMELGLMDTQFTNAGGAYDTEQYSTAHDCAVITQAASRYQLIKEAIARLTVSVTAASSGGEREITYTSTNPLLTASKPSERYSLSRGGMAGTLEEPDRSTQYAGIATSDDMQLIVVIMDAKPSRLAYGAKALLEYGDSKVTRNIIVKAGKRVGTARVKGGNVTHVHAYTETKGFAYVPPEGSSELVRTETVMFDNLEAPLKEGSKVGEFRIYVADELKGTVDLVIRREVSRGWLLSRYYISNMVTVIICAVIALILLLILRIVHVRRHRARIRAARREKRLRELARQQLELEEDRRRRNWDTRTVSGAMSGYETRTDLRTGDLREQARRDTMREELIAEAARTGTSPKTIMKKNARTEKKRAAAREKAKSRKDQADPDGQNE